MRRVREGLLWALESIASRLAAYCMTLGGECPNMTWTINPKTRVGLVAEEEALVSIGGRDQQNSGVSVGCGCRTLQGQA